MRTSVNPSPHRPEPLSEPPKPQFPTFRFRSDPVYGKTKNQVGAPMRIIRDGVASKPFLRVVSMFRLITFLRAEACEIFLTRVGAELSYFGERNLEL